MPNLYSCPTCAAVIVPQESGGACPKCRTPLPQSEIETVVPQDLPGMDDATRLAPGSGAAPSKSSSRPASHRDGRDSRPSSSTGWLSSSGAIDHGRFEPGTLLGGRYRIVERLGRGGMGEVFRADDLKLGQPVALKFLPPDVDKDPARLTQLHTEVRMARQVSHPNVCRVYDIDEVDGTTFLSMEYVDGEDLGTLLKRVGRFPEERGLEIARQICAGLAAAHERDVIHRDLKPANVMLDGSGKVRITDFGLAGASGEAIRAGTPAYMAPEQLSGQEVTARSDIYALGLVLYEIFTGQRALEASNLAELIHKREQSGIPPATAIVKSLDPKIERVIAKCLKPEVDERPVSALAVAAALPGGDPLAAALAAGETPSPAMVAAAGSRDVLSLRATMAAAAWIVLSLLAVVLLYQRVILLNRVPLPKPPAALQDRAQEALASLGFDPAAAVDTASGLGLSLDYARFIEATSTAPDRWNLLRTVRPETFFLWYRTSPILLVPWGTEFPVGRANPPMTTAGMTLVAVDANGRLSEFHCGPEPALIRRACESDGLERPFCGGWAAVRSVRADQTRDHAALLRRRAARVGRAAPRSSGAHRPHRGGRDGGTTRLLRSRRTMEPLGAERQPSGIAVLADHLRPGGHHHAGIDGARRGARQDQPEGRTRRSRRRFPRGDVHLRDEPSRDGSSARATFQRLATRSDEFSRRRPRPLRCRAAVAHLSRPGAVRAPLFA